LGDTTLTGFDFVGVKMGDANSNASLQNPSDRGAPLYLETEAQWLEAGMEYWVPLRLTEPAELDGWQLALQANPELLEIENVHGVPPQFVALDETGHLRISCVYDAPLAFKTGEPLISVLVRAKKPVSLANALKLNTSVLAAEAYMAAAVPIRAIQFHVGGSLSSGVQFSAPRPNPFSNKTEWDLVLDMPQTVQLDVFSVTGKQLYHVEHLFEAGSHTLTVLASDLPESGVLTFRIIAGEQVSTGRLVRF
jgi:hypothetical protein